MWRKLIRIVLGETALVLLVAGVAGGWWPWRLQLAAKDGSEVKLCGEHGALELRWEYREKPTDQPGRALEWEWLGYRFCLHPEAEPAPRPAPPGAYYLEDDLEVPPPKSVLHWRGELAGPIWTPMVLAGLLLSLILWQRPGRRQREERVTPTEQVKSILRCRRVRGWVLSLHGHLVVCLAFIAIAGYSGCWKLGWYVSAAGWCTLAGDHGRISLARFEYRAASYIPNLAFEVGKWGHRVGVNQLGPPIWHDCIQMPVWTPLGLSLVYPTVAGLGFWRRRRRLRGRPLCRMCGYDLTGNVSGVCPECGERV